MENSPSIRELVTDAVNTPDVPGPGRVFFDFFPYVSDMAIDSPVGDGQIIDSPYVIKKFVPRDDLPFSHDHKLKYPEFKRSQA